MSDLKSMGIYTGQTMTAETLAAAIKANLPAAAMAELWERRTLDTEVMKLIEAAVNDSRTKGKATIAVKSAEVKEN